MKASLLVSRDSFDSLLINDTPMIDVRAAVEFNRGALPASINLPILNDDERHEVGLCYEKEGDAAANALGYRIVSGDVKTSRIDSWLSFLGQHPDAHLYCHRGGQRSSIACGWLNEAGLRVPRIEGGYKALRNHLLGAFENLPGLLIVAGRTGGGKTEFIQSFDEAIDLEGIANHRGSAFGRRISEQPDQVNFENTVAIQFLKRRDRSEVLLEDEGRLIGRISLPVPLQEKMKTSPVVVIEEALHTRVERIYQEYIALQWQEYEACYAAAAFEKFQDYLLTAVDAIRKRLGGVAHVSIRQMIVEAGSHYQRNGTLEAHYRWIESLLNDYYDPMYNYQMEKKAERIRFQGTRTEAADWCRSRLSEN